MSTKAWVKPPAPWDVEVQVPYAEKDEFKKVPGSHWSGNGDGWLVPREHSAQELTKDLGFSLSGDVCPELFSRLAKHQQLGFMRALADPTGFMLNWDTGLGKTYGALAISLAVRSAPCVLVVCPASAKKVWEKLGRLWKFQVSTYWPKKAHTWENFPVEEAPAGFLTIINYENIEKLPEGITWDVIISDECHYLKNTANGKIAKAPKRTRAMFDLRDSNPGAYRLALSATPAADHPVDLWGQLEWLHPGRWGTYWKFVQYFHETSHDSLGHMVIGESKNSDVFRKRFSAVSHSVRKEEIEMVPYTITTQRDVNWTLDAETLVLCDTHKEVERLGALWPDALAFHGGTGVKRRLALIEQAELERRPIITTMHCVKEAIDLTNWTRTIYPEASYQILPLLQSMGRTHRMNSTKPVSYEFHVKGPFEEKKIARVVEKIKSIQKLIPAGMDLSTYLEKHFGQEEFERELAEMDLSGLEWEETE